MPASALAGAIVSHVTGGRRLGIDLGTTNTVAVIAGPRDPARPLLFDGSELLPSAVFLDATGTLLTGRDALRAGRVAPERLEPSPKRCVDNPTVLLGQVEVPVVDLLAAVLRRVAAEASWAAAADTVTLTCPAGWGPRRRAVLAAAATAAGLGDPRLVAEPVAAAASQATPRGGGGPVLVYDLGAGTFDASVVRQTAAGIEVLATRGLADVGGLDIDAAVAAEVGQVYAVRDASLWRRLTAPQSTADRRMRQQWQDEIRAGKEALSRGSHTTIFVPLFDEEVMLGRPELERVARPTLDATVHTTREVLAEAGLTGADLRAVLLVGGSSRIPLAATLIHQALGVPPTIAERPELVVADGSLAVPDASTLPGQPTLAAATNRYDVEGTVLRVERTGGNAVEAVRRDGRETTRYTPPDYGETRAFTCTGDTLTLGDIEKVELARAR